MLCDEIYELLSKQIGQSLDIDALWTLTRYGLNPHSREILVTKIGCQSIKAATAEKPSHTRKPKLPDLIFMDLDLPDLDGVKTTAILKQNPQTSQIPVVAVTAWMSAL